MTAARFHLRRWRWWWWWRWRTPASLERARAQDHPRRALRRGELSPSAPPSSRQPRRPRSNATILLKHFSSITAENAMKPDTVWPNKAGTGGSDFGTSGLTRTSRPATRSRPSPSTTACSCAATRCCGTRSVPTWFFAGDPVGDPVSYRINVQQRLRDYIYAVVQHFPNVYAWDVVNEVASDTPNAANPVSHQQSLVHRLQRGRWRSDRIRARRLPVRQPGAQPDRAQQLQHEAHAERLQHRAGRQTRQCHAPSCRTSSNAGIAHRRCRPPVPPAAQRRCRPGDGGVPGGRRRCRRPWSIT